MSIRRRAIKIIKILLIPILYITFLFLGRGFISGGDIFYPINAISLIYLWWGSYLDQFYLGIPSITYMNAVVPYFMFFGVFSFLTTNVAIVQKIWLGGCLLLMFLSFYYLLDCLSFTKKIAIPIKITTSLFYIFNPFTSVMLLLSNFLLVCAAIPLYLALLYRYFETTDIKYLLSISVSSVFLVYSTTNPALYSILIFSCILFLIYNLFIHRCDLSLKSVYDLVVFAASYILINIFWILSFLNIGNTLSSVQYGDSWFWTSSSSTILNIFRLLGFWGFDQQAFGSFYFPYHSFYNHIIIIIVSFVLLIIAVMSLMQTRQQPIIYFFAITFIIGVYLAKGVQEPFKDVFIYWCHNIPGFWIYREPWTKWMLVVLVSFSLMLGYGIFSLYVKIRSKRHSELFLIIIFLLVIINSYPILSGNAVVGDRGRFPGVEIQIPTYWFECSDYINTNVNQGRILLLPQNTFYQLHYNWWLDGYYGIDPVPYFIFRPLISLESGGGYITQQYSCRVIEMFYENYLVDSSLNWGNYLALMNTKYILHRKDLDWTHIGSKDVGEPKKIKELIHETNLSILDRSFGKFDLDRIKTDQYFIDYLLFKYPQIMDESALDLYVINSSLFLPCVYTPIDIIISEGDVEQLPKIVSLEEYNLRSATIFEDQVPRKLNKKIRNMHNVQMLDMAIEKSDISEIVFLINNKNILKLSNRNGSENNIATPILEFKKISSTKYRIRVHDATVPFLLVFSESYYDGWKLYPSYYLKQQPLDDLCLTDYRILTVDENYQATKTEVVNFIKNGWVTDLRYDKNNKYVDFISKNFQNSIQNNNLPNGTFYETWFKKPIDNNENHLMANGYANSWIIDPTDIYSRGSGLRSSDGSYDFELTIEFQPQRLFYAGLSISSMTLLTCLIYILICWLKSSG